MLNPARVHNPEDQRVTDLPVAGFLRRETGVDCLVVYQEDQTDKWVVALLQDGMILDVGALTDTGDENGHDFNHESVHEIIRRLKVLVTKAEAVQRMKDENRKKLGEWWERQQSYDEAHKAIHQEVKKRHGPLEAEKFAMGSNSMVACGLNKPKGFNG